MFVRFSARAVVASLLLAQLAACSHSRPYRRGRGPVDFSVIPHAGVVERVIFVGDAGEPADEEPTLALLAEWTKPLGRKATVVFLGDNIYEVGLPPVDAPGYAKARDRFLGQLAPVAAAGSAALVIPGNHDWRQPDGVLGLVRQADLVADTLGARGAFLPTPGCPGPAIYELDYARIVVLDTEWWLQDVEERADLPCAHATGEFVQQTLSAAVTATAGRPVIVVGHHPIRSRGHHSGFRSWRDHLFPLRRFAPSLWLPLPGLTLLEPLIGHRRQDMRSDRNRAMTRAIGAALTAAQSRPLLYVSGHDHNLQIFDGDTRADFLVVSGAGAKVEDVGHDSMTRFAHAHAGFVVLDVVSDGSKEVRRVLRVVEPNAGVVAELDLAMK